ncbi:GNAT superfamily N-acetyltransferase [Nocardioides luteus]|uniref:N-acetyltransferase domain-containing protein n=1 Tax=Nocardioides luteus TaxID=1844 RepID=A0ABQ5T140_9ACTN|nr:GNAT family protein [Nocardioides luteus]MDR7310635.1 GNAT superfamily N-acetyltransferase [Nocardioides luteus]GGR41642.1 hypothetical protein GCM10010197_03610 [Nocardioides luteus]GLJ69585.1 hypothetical protein GCM10017579_36210 [Nocardioides luteus]
MTTIAEALPMLGLRINAGPLEMRGITDGLLGPLADIVVAGIHDPDAMPFYVPWSIAPADGETGAWLGRAHQGRGIGAAMRQVLCAFAFDHLDATEVTSGAFTDNPAALGVSRKVGYHDNGRDRVERREGELAVVQKLALTPEELVRFGHPPGIDGLGNFRRSIGLVEA